MVRFSGLLSSGSIEIICGPMFSGKTEELIRRVRRSQIARQKVQIFKPGIDDRYSKEDVVSHSSQSIKAIPVKTSLDILKNLYDTTRVVAIDEVQFFEEDMVEVIHSLKTSGKHVIASGLDMDFRGLPFGIMPKLLALSDVVTALKAKCVICSGPATHSQRLINGKPAKWNDPVIMVGAEELYQPRCTGCFKIDKPE